MHKKGVDVTVSEISEKVHSGEEIMIRKILTRFDPMVQRSWKESVRYKKLQT